MGGGQLCPTRRLIFAVLQRAIWDFVQFADTPDGHPGKRLAIDAAEWLFSDDEPSEDRYTFVFVCEALNLDPGMLRNRVMDMTKRDAQRVNDSGRGL